ncbi:hypothetical protein SPRG_20227 [Saprolegnia parasitica CBS 223.65]|uniref:CASTOR/POLLUX/SYM8 ion channel conserved domain-containing protein n=1 Tax=Saprolegnia parasitica (strain CBS 223.65) TaxID=695850 RepID=A0A067CBC7_SAPPC|nr:hypothetical protein SPRG_20227 [Saprolegnia parasitica CBS 223.65]KDO28069.1 hypothetical protein SPRG_20227 [Saprolegnia parasitica CBS 223.65]|eukprot:XP_012201216.1 hypothetical protein SPRG_20227 [Saprolegnia parasitica CBS 223.65]
MPADDTLALATADDGNDQSFMTVEKAPPRHARWLYRLDAFISRNDGQAIVLVTLCILFACSLAPLVVWTSAFSYANAAWRVWTYMADTGSQNEAVEWPERAVALGSTLLGFAYFAVVVGFVVDAIREKMEVLKEGRSQVVELGHTLMLGWSDKSLSFLKEICNANESEGGGTVVVLAEDHKDELEALIDTQLTKRLGTRILIRHGSPLIMTDLLRSDSNLLRVILTLHNLPQLNGHIVVDVCDGDNESLLELVGGDVLETVASHDVIGEMIVMCSRSPGLANVYASLLGFGGNEFYIETWPECDGVPFGELHARFLDAIPIGIQEVTGRVVIKPATHRRMAPGEGILVLAEDNDSYKAAPPVPIDMGAPLSLERPRPSPQCILIAGWRRDIRNMLRLLDKLSVAGTVVVLMNDTPIAERNATFLDEGFNVNSLVNITVQHRVGNPAVRRHVNTLDLAAFDAYMVVADMNREVNILDSDSHVLATVLTIRSCEDEQMDKKGQQYLAKSVLQGVRALAPRRLTPCIAEVLDPRTQRTIDSNERVRRSSDFIQSNHLVSQMIAMVSENRLVKGMLAELLGDRGASFDVVPSKQFCRQQEKLSLFQVAQRALAVSDEIVCGYRKMAETTFVLNPPQKTRVQTWDAYDFIVLRANDRQRHIDMAMRVTNTLAQHLRRSRFRDFMRQHSFVEKEVGTTDAPKPPKVAFKRTLVASRLYDLWAMTEELSTMVRDGVLPDDVSRDLVTEY